MDSSITIDIDHGKQDHVLNLYKACNNKYSSSKKKLHTLKWSLLFRGVLAINFSTVGVVLKSNHTETEG